MLEKISRLQHLRNSGGRHSVEIIDLAQKVWCEDTRKCASRLGDDGQSMYGEFAILKWRRTYKFSCRNF